jgi:hypothetical protein
MGRRGGRRKQLLDDLKERRVYWKLKEEALDRFLGRTRFGRGQGPVVRLRCCYYYYYYCAVSIIGHLAVDSAH